MVPNVNIKRNFIPTQSVSITQSKMKLLESLIFTCFCVTLLTTAISATKKPASSTEDCSKKLPMTALSCCAMPQFIPQAIITGCRTTSMQALAGQPRDPTVDGPPAAFFDCLIDSTNMGNGSKVDKKMAENYLQSQLNATTKNWKKPVTDSCKTCYTAYKKDNKTKTFMDCLLKEFYTVSTL